MKTKITRWFAVLLLIIQGCDQPFSFSPFDAGPPAVTNITATNLARIKAMDGQHRETVRIALLSDTHYHFDDMADAIRHINKDTSVSFIIVTGDITENGLKKEFELFHSAMEKATKPYVTVIGNHDHLSNGGTVYEKMFGPLDYSFDFNNIRFVMWDNVLWESNRAPDWKWFENKIQPQVGEAGNTQSTELVIPFSHIPPMDGQLVDSAAVYHQLLVKNNIPLSVHGHRHEYLNEDIYGGGVTYVTVGSPSKRAYAMLTITGTKVTVEQIRY